jgi:hypothetical protein
MSDQLPQDNEFDESAHEIAVADSPTKGFPISPRGPNRQSRQMFGTGGSAA